MQVSRISQKELERLTREVDNLTRMVEEIRRGKA